MIVAEVDAEVKLYHNNTKMLETTSTGVNVQSHGSNYGITVKHSNGNVVAKMTNKGSGDEGFLQLNDAGEVATIKMDAEHGRITTTSIRLGTDDAANELDDYEEGTWTPTINTGFTPTYTHNVGTYTKVGRLVYYNFYLQISSQTGSNTQGSYGVINGLPFTATYDNMLGYGGSTIPWQYQLGQSIEQCYVQQNATQVQLLLAPSGGDRTHSSANTLWNGGDTRIAGGGCYITDS